MRTVGWMIAVSYLEWLRWVATSRLRSSGRVAFVRDDEDQTGFDCLMNRGPDLNIKEENGFVLAKLCGNISGRNQPVRPGAGLDEVWLSIETVESFYPVTDRGRRLLEADATRARVILGDPVFEKLWTSWQKRRLQEQTMQRSEMLCRALNLHAHSSSSVPVDVLDILSGESALPETDRVRRFLGSSAYGWARSFTLFRRLAGDRMIEDFSKRLNLSQTLIDLDKQYPIEKPVMLSPVLPVTHEMSKYLRAHGFTVSVALSAVVFHYRSLLETGRSISVEALLQDITLLGVEEGISISALAANCIAMAMDDAAVSALLYQSAPKHFCALENTDPPCNLNIPFRVAERSSAFPPKKEDQEFAARPAKELESMGIAEQIGSQRLGKDLAGSDTERREGLIESADLGILESISATELQDAATVKHVSMVPATDSAAVANISGDRIAPVPTSDSTCASGPSNVKLGGSLASKCDFVDDLEDGPHTTKVFNDPQAGIDVGALVAEARPCGQSDRGSSPALDQVDNSGKCEFSIIGSHATDAEHINATGQRGGTVKSSTAVQNRRRSGKG